MEQITTGSTVRLTLPGAAANAEGVVVGYYAYEEPVYLVRTASGAVEARDEQLELIEPARPSSRLRAWFTAT